MSGKKPGGKGGASRAGGRTSGASRAGGRTKFTARAPTTQVKTAKNRTNSSARWLQRQLNDPYVAEAQARGYRSRAAFKLLELDGRFGLLKPGMRVLELGAAPGGWTQVIAERLGGTSKFVAVDILEMPPVSGAEILMLDFMAPDAPEIIRRALGGPADAVLSDMAAPATGHSATDALRVSALAEAAFEFALEVLAPGGVFAAKVLQGGTEAKILARVRRAFGSVRHAKPPASRADSPEAYLAAQGFRGAEGFRGADGAKGA